MKIFRKSIDEFFLNTVTEKKFFDKFRDDLEIVIKEIFEYQYPNPKKLGYAFGGSIAKILNDPEKLLKNLPIHVDEYDFSVGIPNLYLHLLKAKNLKYYIENGYIRVNYKGNDWFFTDSDRYEKMINITESGIPYLKREILIRTSSNWKRPKDLLYLSFLKGETDTELLKKVLSEPIIVNAKSEIRIEPGTNLLNPEGWEPNSSQLQLLTDILQTKLDYDNFLTIWESLPEFKKPKNHVPDLTELINK